MHRTMPTCWDNERQSLVSACANNIRKCWKWKLHAVNNNNSPNRSLSSPNPPKRRSPSTSACWIVCVGIEMHSKLAAIPLNPPCSALTTLFSKSPFYWIIQQYTCCQLWHIPKLFLQTNIHLAMVYSIWDDWSTYFYQKTTLLYLNSISIENKLV